MSTGAECHYIEPQPGQWYYGLQMNPGEQCWDWREELVEVAGPFPTEDAAREHLHDHNANPGGSHVIPHSAFTMDPVYAQWIATATPPGRHVW